MKTIAIAAVTAGGKTTIINELKRRLKNSYSLHFDNYSFEGEVDDFNKWGREGAKYNVWNLAPLVDDVNKIQIEGKYDYLLLDYPFAYCHKALKNKIDVAIFIDTPLDIALARRTLRDMKKASGDEIRNEMEGYLKYARIAYLQMLKDILPSSDYVVDGSLKIDEITSKIMEIIE